MIHHSSYTACPAMLSEPVQQAVRVSFYPDVIDCPECKVGMQNKLIDILQHVLSWDRPRSAQDMLNETRDVMGGLGFPVWNETRNLPSLAQKLHHNRYWRNAGIDG